MLPCRILLSKGAVRSAIENMGIWQSLRKLPPTGSTAGQPALRSYIYIRAEENTLQDFFVLQGVHIHIKGLNKQLVFF